MDWTFDLFMEDAKKYSATPIKGVYCSSNASYREYFMTEFKNFAREFKKQWLEQYTYEYSNIAGWIGDAFARELAGWYFSDFYKDAYGQRPHLAIWFYVQALDMPQSQDVSRRFCASPVEDAIDQAKRIRDRLTD